MGFSKKRKIQPTISITTSNFLILIVYISCCYAYLFFVNISPFLELFMDCKNGFCTIVRDCGPGVKWYGLVFICLYLYFRIRIQPHAAQSLANSAELTGLAVTNAPPLSRIAVPASNGLANGCKRFMIFMEYLFLSLYIYTLNCIYTYFCYN